MRGKKAKALRALTKKATLPWVNYEQEHHQVWVRDGKKQQREFRTTVVLHNCRRALYQQAKATYIKARAEGLPWRAI